MADITKNQHFVPRLLLRHFAKGENGAIQIYDSIRDFLRPPTSIHRVFAQNYFYDDDNVVEKFLAKNVEAPAAPHIDAIMSSPESTIPSNNIDLLRFIAVQMNRTPQALHTALNWIDLHSSMLIQKIGELNGFSADDIEGIKLKLKDERAVLARQTIEGALNWPLLQDLSWHVIFNDTDLPFVISDHPVVHYNWYLRNSNNKSYTSLTNFGVQIFLPLSPNITLALIDKSTYKFGDKGTVFTKIHKISDIEILNSLQFRARQAFIVFPEGMDSKYITSRCKKYPANSLHANHAWSSDAVDIGDNKLKSTQETWRTQCTLPRWLSVSKIKRRVAKKALICSDRKPEIVKAHMIYLARTRNRSNTS